MELRQLQAFEAVLETGTFAAAAKLRHVAQPALWASVKGLERELDVALFERDGRRVRPTAAAVLLRNRLRLVLDDVRALLPHARSDHRGGKSKVADRLVDRLPFDLSHRNSPIKDIGHRSDGNTRAVGNVHNRNRALHSDLPAAA